MTSATPGLSPYLRGTPEIRSRRYFGLRFIPVLTGNTVRAERFVLAVLVYPRTYGEHNGDIDARDGVYGLSPYLRGTHINEYGASINVRFIPVLTGNTINSFDICHITPVYPRTYGEHIRGGQATVLRHGLSPYLRGTPCPQHAVIIKTRFIPVLTGNTRSLMFISLCIPVYPRTYGEHLVTGRELNQFCGLSPYLRGTRQCETQFGDHRRFIPVLTGNT